ncbi:hypothetical protein BKA70DRAFT_1272753 [Coprinopsis sp. MPI-PUGE-AT-0042]|nr:hypothetical protein BKA70DRAFT_1272753 [Coprinopsis sp. MPI-PUGE-AT-0042]
MSANFENATAGAVASSSAPMSIIAGGPVRREKQRSMSKKGTKYLTDWAAIHGLSPTREQKEALVAGVKAIPGHDYYEVRHVAQWFASRRRQARKEAASPASGSPAPPAACSDLATTLSAKQISHLQLLAASTAFIDDNILGIWAELFKVEKQVLQTWLRDTAPILPPTPITPTHPAWVPAGLSEAASRMGVSVEQWRHTLSNEASHQRLPTPAATASPGPESPLLTHAQVTRPQSRNAGTLLPVAQLEAVPVEPINPRPSVPDPIRDALLQGIKEGSSTSSQAHRPKTTAEFNAFWKTFEPKLNRVAQALDLSQAT